MAIQEKLLDDQRKLFEEQQKKVGRMQMQLELFNVKGVSPSQHSYRNYLKDIKRLSRGRTPYPLRCFISYAWETDPAARKGLQKRLERLKDELKVAGMEVTLDVRDMRDDMQKFMVQGINNSHKVLLICTPRLKLRAAETTKNSLQLV